jgi:hypothetical protein
MSDPASTVCYRLEVDGNHVRQALRQFRIPRKYPPSEKASLAFDGQYFSIIMLDCAVAMSAQGSWPGTAEVSAKAMEALLRFPPSGNSLEVVCDGKQVRIGTLQVSCVWRPVSHTLSKLPGAPDWIEALSLKYRATHAQIREARLDERIRKADRQLEKLTSRVAKSLAPLGVTEQEVRDLVEASMARKYAGSR